MDNAAIERVVLGNEIYYKISNSDGIRPFFMSIVSDSNHWMFISSNGGLTAGRKNAEYALFPYYTDDKITHSSERTGSKTILQVHRNGTTYLWEPFSIRNEGRYTITRNLYKSQFGNKIRFEEINEDLELTYAYEWCSSNLYGFVRKSRLSNNSTEAIQIHFIDGIQNIMPYGVASDLQNAASNLVSAYKRNELHQDTGLGIYALSAIIVDKAEPSEALKANVVYSKGLDNPKYLLSSLQLNAFRQLQAVSEELDIKGEDGAYFVNQEVLLNGGEDKKWMIVANVNQDHSSVAKLIYLLQSSSTLVIDIENNIDLGTKKLIALNASADGLQSTADPLKDTRHFANVLFNNMRGGIFDHNYNIEKWDFCQYLENANKTVYNTHKQFCEDLPDILSLQELKQKIGNIKDNDFIRLTIEYLPIRFSRRHGDPSRPWNKFSINTRSEIDGSKILDYEGNWRDIFQNWEAMAYAFPEFIEGMIYKFLNASTFDGYNPYRVTKGGFDWEVLEPDDPWSYIGYWGDHQIIYLLKFLEFSEKHYPGKLQSLFDKEIFVYANVPYTIKPHSDILNNPKDTIDFNEEADKNIRSEREKLGADGALLKNEHGEIHHVNFIEKMLATLLAKVSNYVPEGGIWMNTQRPEWNDANNALVGNGISMVTLYYLRRFLHFFNNLLAGSETESIKVSNELMDYYKQVRLVFEENIDLLNHDITDTKRKNILDRLGKASSEYRNHIYEKSFWGKKRSISKSGLTKFVNNTIDHIEQTIQANKRTDNLYHAYNLLTIESDEIKIDHLNEMLEGQVAVLSSGYLSAADSLSVLDAMKNSALFRDDQYSYLLYPNKQLPGFLNKNTIPEELVSSSQLLQHFIETGDSRIISKDVFGEVHFNGDFRNVKDLNAALQKLDSGAMASLVKEESNQLKIIFEKVFNHKAFTGRSGTFYGYEGLGSIYWHMVSKLLLAVQECCIRAIENDEDAETTGRLLEHFYEINAGIGVHKSPKLYGAFPTDPYSHTPGQKGAQQPGMTGQVKEDILSRFGELGIFIKNGCITFHPCLLRKQEFHKKNTIFKYIDINGQEHQLELSPGSLAFTYCQIPVKYIIADEDKLKLRFKGGGVQVFNNLNLDRKISNSIFQRSNDVLIIEAYISDNHLK